MNDKKKVGDTTEPCGTPLLIGLEEEQWPSTTAAIKWSERKLERKIETEKWKFISSSFVPDSIKSF